MNIYEEPVKNNLLVMGEAFRKADYRRVIHLGTVLVTDNSEFFQNIYVLYFMGKSYENTYDFAKAVQYYIQMTSLDFNEADFMASFADLDITLNTRIFFFTGLFMLGQEKYSDAMQYFQKFLEYDPQNEATLYYMGVVSLYLSKPHDAIGYLQASTDIYKDDAKLFALGCAAYLKGELGVAKKYFLQSLNAEFFVEEVSNNLKVLANLERTTTSTELNQLPKIRLSYIADGCYIDNYKEIPIFINSRDRVECLRLLVNALLKRGYENIFIIDNGSTYLPLKKYYDSLVNTSVSVIFLSENKGHRALWDTKILDRINIKTPYIYTDSDVLPMDECPEDFVLYMLKVLRQNSTIQKVGLSLRLDDVPIIRFPENERQFWELEFAPNLYYAYTDTTFALYRAGRRFYINEAVRIGYPYMARHLPWYYDMDNLPADEVYYMERANASSTFAKTYREKK